jgi:DNA modification methylase
VNLGSGVSISQHLGQNVALYNGDCLAVMRTLPDNSVDSVITDPPYGLSAPPDIAVVLNHWLNDEEYLHSAKGFMNSAWDSFVPGPLVWKEVFRVLKPGGHLVAFAGSRTHDLMGMSIRLAGFEIRDSISWVSAQGMPKSLNVQKALAKQGNEDADNWTGFGTALKPASEPITVARKPLAGTVTANVLAHGTGALNIDGCRTSMSDADAANINAKHAGMDPATYERQPGTSLNLSVNPMALKQAEAHADGRWPTNFILSHSPDCGSDDNLWSCTPECPIPELDAQSGQSTSTSGKHRASKPRDGVFNGANSGLSTATGPEYDDAGGASRFFPTFVFGAKAKKHERPNVEGVAHSTVKPLSVMRWLVRLITPPGGVVLEPFGGSGTTAEAAILEGFDCIIIERETDFCSLIEQRMSKHPAKRPQDDVEAS